MASAMAAAPLVQVAISSLSDSSKLSSVHSLGNANSIFVSAPLSSQSRLRSRCVRSEIKQESNVEKAVKTVAIVSAASFSVASPASAVDTEAVNSVIGQIEDFTQQAGAAASTAYDYASDFAGQVVDVLTPLVKAAAPVVQQATQTAIEIATPFASDVANQAQKALNDAGVDTAPVVEAAKTAATVAGGVSQQTGRALEAATPVASSTFETLSALDPPVLAAGAGALVLLYLLSPSLFSSVAYAARGYAGELTAAQTLDLLTQTDYTLVDVRTERERGKSGVPSLPRSANNKLISVPVEEVSSKLRGQLRNPKGVEAELAAIKISALKRLNKNSKIAILDSNGSSSRQVAKSLSALGFKNAFIVKDGMDGKSGWVQSQLGTEDYNYGGATVMSPSRIIPAATRIFSRNSSSEVVDVPRRGFLLPGGSSDE